MGLFLFALLVLVLLAALVAALQGRFDVTGRWAGGAAPDTHAASAAGPGVAELVLRLPEPARTQAWALLCRLADTEAVSVDARTRFLLTQTRDAYLPDTVEAFLALPGGARRNLLAQGQAPEQLLEEQLSLMTEGVQEALRHEHAAADRLLTQGRFLRERFGSGTLLPVEERRGG